MKSFVATAQKGLCNVSEIAAIALCLSIPVSRTLFETAAVLMICCGLLSGNWQKKWTRVKGQPATVLFFAFVAWVFLSSFWSAGSPDNIAHAAHVQWKLLVIPFIVVVVDRESLARRCWLAFGLGMIILSLHILIGTWASLPWTSNALERLFYNPIPQSVGLAIFASLCLHCLPVNSLSWRIKALASVGFAVATYAVFFISVQRQGYASWLLGCGIVLFLGLPRRKRRSGLVAMLILVGVIVGSNPTIQTRVDQAFTQAIEYTAGKENFTSVGARLHMWWTAAEVIKEAPLIGQGLGSYTTVARARFDSPAMCAIGCNHPHNQYLFYLLEYGGIGFAFFASAILLAIRRVSIVPNNHVASNVVLYVFLAISFMDTTLWYRGFFYLFAPLLGLAFAHPTTESDQPQAENTAR